VQHRYLRLDLGLAVLTAALCAAAGGLAAFAMSRFPGYEPLALAGLLATAPIIAISVARFHAMVFLAFAALGVVRVEPAPVDLLMLLLLGVGAVFGQLSLTQLRGSSTVHSLILVFLGLNLAALVGADDLAYSLRYTAITLYLVAVCYFVRLYVDSPGRMRTALLGYLVAALFSVGLVALDFAGLSPVGELFVFESRARALFKDANVFAPFLVLPIVWLLDELLRPNLLPWRPWLKVALIVALSVGVLTAFSRAAWANLAVSLFVYVALSAPWLRPAQWARLLLPGVVGAVALAVLIVRLGMLDFLRMRATPLQSYDSGRFGTQLAGVEAGLSNPLGIGPGMLYNAHSLYIRTFAEYGPLGLAVLLALLALLLWWCLRLALRADDRAHGLSARVVFACAVGLLLNSIVIDTIHWRSFWVMLAFCWVAASCARPARGSA
jgi:hypothetical protein